jgi:mono/diheme cytochrome c family protein
MTRDSGIDSGRLDSSVPTDSGARDAQDASDPDAPSPDSSVALGPCDLDDGQCIFRHDTFGDEQLWTDVLRLHELVGAVPPTAALGLGLKVDSDAVPAEVLATADLEDPATTVALLGLDAVVGLHATVEDGVVTRIGVTCALCHSNVNDSVMAGVGSRLDGHPNRDLDPGAIIALTPGVGTLATMLGVEAEVALAALNSWGPGRYDARFNQDGENDPVLIPPAYGLADVALETYTGDGPISYWNAYVAVTQMGGHGNFADERLGLNIVQTPDMVTPKLPALRDYQFTLAAPSPPADSFNEAAAARGRALFEGDAQCSTCHAGDSFTDAPMLHTPAEVGMEPNAAQRSATGMYRTTPLRGAWQRAPYFHDGSAETFAEVVEHYETLLDLDLTGAERTDLVEYLKSL